ncbi:MAG TPA: class I SAM-dependent methyltransferase [Desulfofustis sp.]|jgi:SAM-dependent methyltransferase|nr:methyltransferase domain-containing protein [Desulfofustis sp. PB-SRB1]HBH28927.1 class I SAM-dependent methyltransferase [Desulfofustis sp.]
MGTETEVHTYEDIDWLALWQNARQSSPAPPGDSRRWDKRASGFMARTARSPYITHLISQLNITRKSTILDVGCGPGTLAIPLARRAGKVTAVDYSEEMLNLLKSRAGKAALKNIVPIRCAWEDDWRHHGIGIHDIAIASRSLNVADLGAAIDTLIEHASHQVVLVERISPTPRDPEAFAAVGRPFKHGPDYRYTLNILISKGIHPEVHHIEMSGHQRFATMDEAVAAYAWMFDDLTNEEYDRLSSYVKTRVVHDHDGNLVVARKYPQRWAMISWQTQRASDDQPSSPPPRSPENQSA